MMRLPRFRYLAAKSVDEAARALADHGPEAMLLAGGTDLLPNMKRRQQVPKIVVGLREIEELTVQSNGTGLMLGAGRTLTEVASAPAVREPYRGLFEAAIQVASPQLRNMGTIGGNLCLDTRCYYYDQNYEWRKQIDFCMKKDGEICWVAPSSKKCLAVSSTDTAPALMSLGARVVLRSAKDGERELPLCQLYANDGIHYLTRRPDEILTKVVLDEMDGWDSTYWKLRRRGSFDFPVLSVAAASRRAADGTVEEARIVLGAAASRPQLSGKAAEAIVGRKLTDGVIEEAADAAFQLAKPMDNTDFALHWRKRVTRAFVRYALRDLRGDDMRATRRSVARRELDVV